VNGDVAIRAQNGTFNFDTLRLATDATTLEATGNLSPNGNSDLRFSLVSTKAEELQTIATSFGVGQDLLAESNPVISGNFNFNGRITGSINDPTLEGDLNLASVGLREQPVGSFSGHIFLSPTEARLD